MFNVENVEQPKYLPRADLKAGCVYKVVDPRVSAHLIRIGEIVTVCSSSDGNMLAYHDSVNLLTVRHLGCFDANALFEYIGRVTDISLKVKQ